jgi:hypothetical protein
MEKHIDAGKQEVINRIMKPPWKKTLYFLAIILSILAYKEPYAKMNERHPELPKTVGAWQIFGSPKQVDASNIFDYMNGAGELYLAYRFKKLEVYEYRAVDRENILAEIYFMETPDDAFGLLSQDWDGEPVDLRPFCRSEKVKLRAPKSRALYGSGLLRIAAGSTYVRIMTLVETPESKEVVLSLGRTVMGAEKCPQEPDLLHVLPAEVMNEWNLLSNGICYFRSYLVLNTIYYLSLENILNLERSSEAVTATYEHRAKLEKINPIRVLFVRYADYEKASRALDAFYRSYLSEHDAKGFHPAVAAYSGFFKVEDGWLGYELERDYLAFIFQCPDEKSARGILNAITFNLTETARPTGSSGRFIPSL